MGRKIQSPHKRAVNVALYPIPRLKERPDTARRAQPDNPKEALTGFVYDQPASDIEERFAIALGMVDGVEFEFQPSFIAGRNVTGEIRLDFMVYYGGGLMQPVQIDGEFAHGSSQQKAEDEEKDMLLNYHLRGSGAFPVKRIPGSLLSTIEAARELCSQLFR